MIHQLVYCECEAKVYKDGSGVDIEYCPLHRAAPDLLKAAKKLVDDYSDLSKRKEVRDNLTDYVFEFFEMIKRI